MEDFYFKFKIRTKIKFSLTVNKWICRPKQKREGRKKTITVKSYCSKPNF